MLEKKDDLESRPDDAPAEKQGKTSEEAHVFEISSATILFQGLLVLSSMYFAVLCTNWGDLSLYTANELPDGTLCPAGEVVRGGVCVINE